ncbi:hypothetical protein B2M26_13970 [Ferroacidibacillus organovorans]|nr:hypothetical protein B2M26_13970 [Ferroacidibacillus organovorans]
MFLSRLQRENRAKLLEIGAGTGRDSMFFEENGLLVTATDLSGEMVLLCREKGLSAEQMDASDLQFPDGHFDGVWTINCLLHVPKRDLPGVLAEVRRVLKPGGLFYFGVYGGMDFEGVWEADRYDPKRFFSFHTDAAIQETVRRFFTLESFRTIDYGNEILHFQAMVLRR